MSILVGALVYLALALLGLLRVQMEKPLTCSKGHADHYCVNRWRCRTCATAAEKRGLRKLARERNRP